MAKLTLDVPAMQSEHQLQMKSNCSLHLGVEYLLHGHFLQNSLSSSSLLTSTCPSELFLPVEDLTRSL